MGGGRCVSHPGGFNCICQDKLVDDSCATGAQNPCVEGSAEYFSNMVDQTKYISCSLGYGFVRTCAPGTIWSQDILTCLMPKPVQSFGQQKPMSQSPLKPSYGQKMLSFFR